MRRFVWSYSINLHYQSHSSSNRGQCWGPSNRQSEEKARLSSRSLPIDVGIERLLTQSYHKNRSHQGYIGFRVSLEEPDKISGIELESDQVADHEVIKEIKLTNNFNR